MGRANITLHTSGSSQNRYHYLKIIKIRQHKEKSIKIFLGHVYENYTTLMKETKGLNKWADTLCS